MCLTCSQLDLHDNKLCRVDWRTGEGKYTPEAIAAIADALGTSRSLTSCDVRRNAICGHGVSSPTPRLMGFAAYAAHALSAAVLANKKIEKFNQIPIKEMRADSLTTLDLSRVGIGVEGALVVADLLKAMTSLTVADLRYNSLDVASATLLASIAKETGVAWPTILS